MNSDSGDSATVRSMLADIGWVRPEPLTITGEGSLPSIFPVTDLAVASIGAAARSVGDLLTAADGRDREVRVNRRLASLWFASSLRPEGWSPPPPWDPIASDYLARDGWIRLHTNAPAHRAAALNVLGVPAEKAAVTAAVSDWSVDALEAAVVGAGGCAASMHSVEDWRRSEQGRAVAAEPLVAWGDIRGDFDPGHHWTLTAESPLCGLRVLDLTRVLAGPVATRFLALFGADVLRIDPPWWEEPGVIPEVMLGKRSARLDLREARDRGTLLELLEGCDILVHGYRPGALDGLDLGPARRRHPGLIEVSLSAYGQTGPWAGRRGFDSLVQMSTGIAAAGMLAARSERPVPLPVQALDHATGYLMAAAAVRALTVRQQTGQGRAASLSLARTARWLLDHSAATSQSSASVAPPVSHESPEDLDPAIENTTWGLTRRLRLPFSIAGVEPATDIPARALGGDAPVWRDRGQASKRE